MPRTGIQTFNRRTIQRAIRTLAPGDLPRQITLENLIEAAAREAWANGVRWAHNNRTEAATIARWPAHMRQHASNEFFQY